MTDSEPTPLRDDENDLDKLIWGAEALGKVINRSPRKTHYLLARGLIDADQIGRLWVSTRRRLLAPFKGKEAA